MSEDRPRLRDLEAFPHREGDRSAVILRDPQRIGPEAVMVSPQFYALLTLFNGRNSVLDLQAELTRRTGRIVFRTEVEEMIDKVDRLFYLDNANFRRRREKLLAEFRAQPVREAHHAGQGYPADREALADLIDSFYRAPEGAGLPSGRRGHRVRALVAPHIDLRLGGATYTYAYRFLAESEPVDLFVILGIGHMGLPRLYSISEKDFRTPLGVAPCDRSYVETVNRVLGDHPFEEDLSHRTEHTIEFQVLFLQHLMGEREFRIAPILASFSYRDLDDSRNLDLIRRLVDALEAAAADLGRKVCYVASVDLAHIGPRYGDDFAPGVPGIPEVMAKDVEALDYVAAGDAEGFLSVIRSESDRRRVCGFPAIYTLLRLVDSWNGRLLAHSHCRIDDSGSFVTCASMAFSSRDSEEG
jgi:MEMO1 family protein